jgi:ABC-type branched-subunit amino acid transport system permease subunit
MSRKLILICMLALAGLTAPLLVYPVLLMKLICFALFACAFNLLLGYGGLLSLGHAAFFGGRAMSLAMPLRSGAFLSNSAWPQALALRQLWAG